MCENDFHVIWRFRNDAILYYPILEQKTGKRGHPKRFDGRINFAKLDLTQCKEYKVNKGKLYGLRVYAKALKRYVSLAIWYPMDGRTDKWQLYFSTDDLMDGREVLQEYFNKSEEPLTQEARQRGMITRVFPRGSNSRGVSNRACCIRRREEPYINPQCATAFQPKIT